MLLRGLSISALVLLLCAASASASDQVKVTGFKSPVKQASQSFDEIIVVRESGLSRAERKEIRSSAGVSFEESLPLKNAELVSVVEGSPQQALDALNRDPDVKYAEPNRRLFATAAKPPFRVSVTDQYFTEQWALENTGQRVGLDFGSYIGIAGADMDARYAWNLGLGTGAQVAVVDGGIDMNHVELEGQFASNEEETPSNGIDDDGNGYVDDVSGWDFVSGDNNPSTIGDDHGSHVAGIIAGKKNSVGFTGAAPNAKIVPLRVLSDAGSGTTDAIIKAFAYAGDMGIPIVNASLGGDGTDKSINDVIAAHPNTLYVVAAGNNSRNLDSLPMTPCSEPASNILCVGASTSSDTRAGFSNYSATAVDVFAPGENIFSAYADNYIGYMSGTSMASPNTAAVAALVVAAKPSITTSELKSLLMSTTDSFPAAAGQSVSGRINAWKAMLAVIPDTDNDGLANALDSCPNNYSASSNGCPADSDSDGVFDESDNCPNVANPDQKDSDGDKKGDACDSSPFGDNSDKDGVIDNKDNCPARANNDQADADKDGVGDVCDQTPRGVDADADGVGLLDDACPAKAGPASQKGCPTNLSAVKVKIKKGRYTLNFRSDQSATISVALAKQSCVKKKCSFKTVKRLSVKATMAKTAKVSLGKLKKGNYQLTFTQAGTELLTGTFKAR